MRCACRIIKTRMQAHSHYVSYLLLHHGSNSYTNATQCSFIRTSPVLFLFQVLSTHEFYPTTSTDLFLLRNVQTLYGTHPASYSKFTASHFPALKLQGATLATHLPNGVEVKNWWSYSSTPPFWLHNTYRENFTFDVRMWLAHTNWRWRRNVDEGTDYDCMTSKHILQSL